MTSSAVALLGVCCLLNTLTLFTVVGTWSVEKEVAMQHPHKPLNLHFVGLVFYDAANYYVYKERSIKGTNINLL